ncbi:DUF4129 domain-containing protein [Flavobacterium magnum]|uniref:DUF4129 domain-containing protein n=1 Tax=Flavobacterium magnum TaxID=2162713 RepID=UPI0011B236DF|nr:DUF4129 domain-containing protein [Flavobacterium magnum]
MNKLLIIGIFFMLSFSGGDVALAFAKNAPAQKLSHKTVLVDESNRVKPTFPDLRKKYRTDEFVYEARAKKMSAWDRFMEWLRDIFGGQGSGNSGNNLGVITKIVAGAIIFFVIFLIVKSIMNKEGKWIFGKRSDKNILRYDEMEKNLQAVDFEKLIRETRISGEKRLMVRYYYLWLLKRMSAQGYITWDAEKTNSDYADELRNSDFKPDFDYLSYLYNYIWYGEFDIDEQTLEKAASAFEKTIKTIPS